MLWVLNRSENIRCWYSLGGGGGGGAGGGVRPFYFEGGGGGLSILRGNVKNMFCLSYQ